MGTVDLPKSGKAVRPQTQGAYLHKTGENRQASLERIFREQAGALSGRLESELPVTRLDEKVYAFISRNYGIISGNFPVLNDEVIHCDSGAVKNTAIKVTAMLENSGGADQFNTGEIEKSTANRQWGIGDLEAYTDNMLRRKAGVGSIVDSQKANSIAACVFKDNGIKPKTVTDLKLSVNIPEKELLDPDFRFKAAAAYLVREVICRRLYESIDNAEILKTASKEETVYFLDGLLNGRLEINSAELEQYLQGMDRSGELEEIRDRGFSAASNLIVSFLNSVNLDCQFLENMKEKRELLIREYEDMDDAILPDEHYQIRLRYLSKAQLLGERAAYDDLLKILSCETLRLWDLLEVIYQDSKSVFKVNDFEDLVRKNKSRLNAGYDPQKPVETPLAAVQGEKENIRVLLAKMEERINNIGDNMSAVERQISQERLSMLEKEFADFENSINPWNLQPGILLDIDLTFIKRKRTTLDAMSKALGRFLDNVVNCFMDA
jgi:hypothetical protein